MHKGHKPKSLTVGSASSFRTSLWACGVGHIVRGNNERSPSTHRGMGNLPCLYFVIPKMKNDQVFSSISLSLFLSFTSTNNLPSTCMWNVQSPSFQQAQSWIEGNKCTTWGWKREGRRENREHANFLIKHNRFVSSYLNFSLQQTRLMSGTAHGKAVWRYKIWARYYCSLKNTRISRL